MYSVTPSVGALWRQLLEGVAKLAGHTIEVLDWPAPLPIAELWDKPDKAAVFMCGLPFSLASPRPEPVAVPVPMMPRSGGQPIYWSEFIVRADSAFHHLSETFGHRIAFTTPESQSGYAAALHYLMQTANDRPLYREIVAPCISPYGALVAVTEGLAEVAPIDSWAFALLQRHAPDLASQVRTVARTEPMPLPLLVASPGHDKQLAEAFLAANDDPALKPVMEALLIERFLKPQVESYAILERLLKSAQDCWRQHPLAEITDPAFTLERDAVNP